MEVSEKRYEYERHQIEIEKEKKKNSKKEEKISDNGSDIDWNDFVVVDTIQIDEDEEARPEFQPEVTLEMLGIDEVGEQVTKETEEKKAKDEADRMITEQSEIEPGMKIVKNYSK